MYSGPHKIKDGLVFGYDTGYNVNNKSLGRGRHFKGPVSTNILEVLNHSRSNTSGANGFVLNGEEVVRIPKVGKRTVKYVEYYNNHSNAGSLGCCPNLFYYHDGYVTGVESSTPYTYSIIYKHTGNYTHPNFMYRYEHQTNGTYNTEQGIHSTARRTHLGNGWYHAWGTFTTQSTTTQLRCYSFLYNYGTTKHKFYVAAISIVKNTSGDTHLIIPPHLMLQPNTSVSSTQSLIDLKRSTNINLSNVSFDSNGQPTFDGTDDYIDTNQTPTVLGVYNSSYTMEAVFKLDTTSGDNMVFGTTTTATGQGLHLGVRNGVVYQGHYSIDRSAGSVSANTWYHVVWIHTGSQSIMYVNGSAINSLASHGAFVGTTNILIGRHWGWFDGQISVAKIFNRALSGQEAQQNFRAYRRRFDI